MTGPERVQALRVMMATDGWKEIIVPAISAAISAVENQWINGTRAKGEERLTDDVLKGRIWSLVWMQSWESRMDALIESIDATNAVDAQTEDHGEGGSPY